MMEILLEKVKGFLVDPASAFRNAREDTAGTVLRYLAVLAIVSAFFSALLVAVMSPAGPFPPVMPAGFPGPVFVFLGILIGAAVGVLLFGAWLHLWVAVLGGSRGMFRTIAAAVYGSTPLLLFGWIPVIGFLFTLWSLYLAVVGVHELQDISMARAILAVFIAVMVPIIILIIIASYLFIAYATTSVVPVS